MKNNRLLIGLGVVLILFFSLMSIGCKSGKERVFLDDKTLEDKSLDNQQIEKAKSQSYSEEPNREDEKEDRLGDQTENKESKALGNDHLQPCSGGKITFQYPPVNLDKIEYIVPLGAMIAEHVTPIDHQYYYAPDWDKTEVEVYAPTDGSVTFVQHFTSPVTDPSSKRFENAVDDYYVLIEHTCTIQSAFIHLDRPIKEIIEKVGTQAYTQINFPVKAGQLIGTYFGAMDYNVFDTEAKVNFIIPKSYESSNYLKVQDPFDYFKPEIREKMRSKSLRSVEPLGGKIDYDIDGKLVGNWFEINTNKFAGLKQERYWAGHLSFAYDPYDQNMIIVSIGTFEENKAEQFAVKSNTPDPAKIDVSSGLIKYELINYEYVVDGQPWNRNTFARNIKGIEGQESKGVILVQMVEDRLIKVEIFPGKTANEISGFTGEEKTFER
ncbi:hypothetical protein HYU21_00335 [Candidatus Woesearchaeota archaeon]|nr:hypothetical protein [Candidatus Woesearchaeota archaeon]